MSFALLAVLLGCETFPPKGYQGDLSAGENAEAASPEANFDWDPDALVLEITGGEGYDFEFGFMEGGDCEDDDTIGCWTGEACAEGGGYVSAAGDPYNFCHPAGSSGATLTYTKGGVDSILDGTAYVSPGQSTAFGDSSYENTVTYYLRDNVSGKCWVWGYDPSLYDDLTTITCSIPTDAR